MFKSKRFIAFIVAVILFVITTYTTKYPPLELAAAISLLTAIYTTAETLRGTTDDSTNTIKTTKTTTTSKNKGL